MSGPARKALVRLLVPAAKAKPSPAMGQSLGSLGVNMMQFCSEFNDRTSRFEDEIPMRVRLEAFNDGSYTFEAFTPPTSWFLKRAAGVAKGASNPGHELAGAVHVKQIYEVSFASQAGDCAGCSGCGGCVAQS